MRTYSPEGVGMSSERLARIGRVMEDFVTDDQLPGIMTLVQRRNRIVHLGMYGKMNIDAGTPIREDALFRIYSMTKPIISVAIMLLLEEGKFSLTDSVSKFIPAFGKTKVFAGSGALGLTLEPQTPPMNVHHLLTHMSGLSYGWFFDNPVEDQYRAVWPTLFKRGEQSLEEVVDALAALPLEFQPGTQWRYSVSTDVLGHLVQVIADQPLDEFLKERIFKPLGMVDTGFHVPAEKIGRLAQIYASPELYNPRPILPEQVGLIGDVTTPTRCPSGGGGLVSTLADYLAFCNMLLSRGVYDGTRIISRKTLDWMTANHVPEHLMPIGMGLDKMDHGFGLGFRILTDLGKARSLRSVGEYGWGGAAQTYFWLDPSEEMIGLMMTQHMPILPYPVQDRFRTLAYAAIVD